MKQQNDADIRLEEANKPMNKTFADRVSRGLWHLDSTRLINQARRRTGLEDFGDPPIEPALSILTRSLEEEGGLHGLGRFLMRGHLLNILETRLRLAAIWREQPDSMLTPVERPVFITGMPRSGSTFLHEVLFQDPESRSPRVWEVMFPIPAPRPGPHHEWRVRRADMNLWLFRRLAPGADEVYPVRAVTPHECVAIHSYTLMSEEFVTTCRVPTYEHYVRTTGLLSAYAWEKRFLQHLQWRSPLKRWVLKAPDHLYALEELFTVFPDAMVVQTHRNPIEVLKSSMQLIEVIHGLFARPDRERLQEREARILADTMERSIRFRDEHPEFADRFLDLNYHEIVSDPMETARRVYQHLDCPLTDIAVERMRQFISTRSRYHRKHNPTLADLGLDVTAETRRFQNYCNRFGIPVQPV
ncbi:MAG TPA: sulfotransferase [Candidatus Sulfotelmatobacter sp.]|nr:sulfotransferase [Candidatus Sulfotelmatobacter sp.]